MKKMLYIDFDETLFDHRGYVAFVSGLLAGEEDISRYTSTFDDYHDVQDTVRMLRLYRHRDHIADALGYEWGHYSNSVRSAVMQNKQDFCYPEVHEFLEYIDTLGDVDVALLTYGDPEYQLYKISLCEHTKRLPVTVVQEPKADYIARYHTADHGVLLDDKAPQRLSGSWQHIWVNRAGARVGMHGAHKIVSTLGADTLTGTHIS